MADRGRREYEPSSYRAGASLPGSRAAFAVPRAPRKQLAPPHHSAWGTGVGPPQPSNREARPWDPVARPPQPAAAETQDAATTRAPQQFDVSGWREVLAPYTEPRLGRAVFDIVTSVVAYLAISVAMYYALSVSLALALRSRSPPQLCWCARSSSFTTARTARSWPPARKPLARYCAGTAASRPFLRWRHDHAVHHATVGRSDRRGTGDVKTLTVTEYHALRGAGALATGCCATRW